MWLLKCCKRSNRTSPSNEPVLCSINDIYYDFTVPRKTDYTDSNGYYRVLRDDHIAFRYQPIRRLGKGSNGDVIEAIDHKENRRVALKIIRRLTVSSGNHEILMNEYLSEYYNQESSYFITRFYTYFTFREHSCIVFELLHDDLRHTILKNSRGLSMPDLRDILRSTLYGLVKIHDANIVHNDIKTSNIMLIRPDLPYVKIVDFGLSQLGHQKYTGKVQTIYFRSPEVMLRLSYGFKSDMWSIGCVAAELYLGHVLFAGTNEDTQIGLIMQMFGKPPRNLVKRSPVGDRYFITEIHPDYSITQSSSDSYALTQEYADFLGSTIPGTKSLQSVLQCSTPLFIDFLQRCFTWLPNERIDSREAINHPWFTTDSLNLGKEPGRITVERRLNLPINQTI